MLEVTTDITLGLGSLMLKVFVFVIPLVVLMEWIKNQRWFDKVIKSATPVFRPLGFRPQAIFSLGAGIIFGITYGAGVLIPQARSGDLDARQIFLITAFLGICHAVFEDTLLFVAVGGNFWIMALTRLSAALIIISLLARLPWLVPRDSPEIQTASVQS